MANKQSDVRASKSLIWSLAVSGCVLVNGALLAAMVSGASRVLDFIQLPSPVLTLLCALVAVIAVVSTTRKAVFPVLERAEHTASAA